MDQIVVVGLGLSELVALSGHVMTGEMVKMCKMGGCLIYQAELCDPCLSGVEVSRCQGGN